MVAFGPDVMTDQQRWSVVHYIQSLRRKDVEINEILAPKDDLVRVTRVEGRLPADPADPLWENDGPNPDRPQSIVAGERLDLRGRRACGSRWKRVAILCTWKDPIADGAPVRVQDFQDAIALQFSMDGAIPFLGMGDTNNPVNIWQWKAGWQQEADGRARTCPSSMPRCTLTRISIPATGQPLTQATLSPSRIVRRWKTPTRAALAP